METLTISKADKTYLNGSRSEYLQQIAKTYPERDSNGYVIGYYIYDNDRRVGGAYPTYEEAKADKVPWEQIVCGYVFTAKGRTIQEVMEKEITL